MADLITADALVQPLATEVAPGAEVVAGTPTAGVTELARVGGVELGIWEMTAGTARDVEADEVFVVLAGDGELHGEDGATIELRPGVVVRLAAGERTEWVVRETVRKLYLTPAD